MNNLKEQIEKILDDSRADRTASGYDHFDVYNATNELESLIRQREEALLRDLIEYMKEEEDYIPCSTKDVLNFAQTRGINLTDHE